MIRTIITTLFAKPTPTDWVPGLGMLFLPGAVRARRHGRSSTPGKDRDHA